MSVKATSLNNIPPCKTRCNITDADTTSSVRYAVKVNTLVTATGEIQILNISLNKDWYIRLYNF